MLIVYFSLTGQTRKFVKKLGYPAREIHGAKDNIAVKEPYLLITPTYDSTVTNILNDFIEFADNTHYACGVCGSGNRNFNLQFCFSAQNFSERYHIPLVHCFEFQGTEQDVEEVKGWIEKYERSHA